MTTSADQPQINNRYHVEVFLGSGQMGCLYRAVDGHTGAAVALKQLPLTKTGISQSFTSSDQQAFLREYQILVELDHPGIVHVFDFGYDRHDQPFYTMEYLQGQDIVSAGLGKTLTYKLELLRQMLEALAYLHGRHILHRDLKPANVFVSHDQVKLVDFGLAVDREVAGQPLQGTAAYMAPELLKGNPPSEASDLYACGVIAYECLAGRHPFDTSNMNNLLLGVLYQGPDTSSLALERPLQDFLSALLAIDPPQRPSAPVAAELLNIQLKTENGKR